MTPNAATIQTYRRRIARILRRAEARPAQAALLLREEAGDLLAELRRLARSEPVVVLEVLLLLLERLVPAVGELEDERGLAGSVIPAIIERVHQILRRDARSAEPSVDRGRALERLFDLWTEDPQGHCHELDRVFQDLAGDPADEARITGLLRDHIAGLPLLFPAARGAGEDLTRTLHLAERHRSERLLGEILAARGNPQFAILVARDHYRRTGDACDLVTALHRGGETEEAIVLARRALASPRSCQRVRLQELLESMLATVPPSPDRISRRNLEQLFLDEPSRKRFDALRRVVPAEQWPRVRSRVLGHLQKHQRVPTLLFSLYLDEGDALEADGLAVTQPVDLAVLTAAAAAVESRHPSIAAGWHLLAAHRRAGLGKPSLDPLILADLRRVRAISQTAGQSEAFRHALERFKARYSHRTRLLAALQEL